MLRYENNKIVKDVSINFLYCLKHFGDKYGVQGARFGDLFGSSRNRPKSLGMCPGTLISHFGIIKAPKIP